MGATALHHRRANINSRRCPMDRRPVRTSSRGGHTATDIRPRRDVNEKYKLTAPGAHLSVEVGLVVTLIGAMVALAFSIVAICVRRPQV